MGFIINGIANIFFEAVGYAIALMLSLVSSLSLDITGNAVGTAKKEGLFDTVFGEARNFTTAFLITAFVLLILLFMFKLLSSLLGPITGNSEEPIALTVSTFISAFLIWFSYDIFRIFQGIANKLLDVFKTKSPDANLFKGKEFFNFFGKDENKLVRNQDIAKEIKKANEHRGERDIYISGDSEDTSLSTLIISFIVFFVIMLNILKLFLEMYERYVVLAVLFYTAPLAFVAICSKSTMDIFKSWVRMVVSQFLLMMMNVFFLSVFAYSFKAQIDQASDHAGFIFNSWTTFITTSILWIGWLMVGQKVDQHLQSVGLSTAQSGGGLAAAIIAGGGTFMSAARSATGLAKSGIQHAYSGGSRINNGMQAAKDGGRFTDGFKQNPKAVRNENMKEQRRSAARDRSELQENRSKLYGADGSMNMDIARDMANNSTGTTGTEARDLALGLGGREALRGAGFSDDQIANKNTKFSLKNGVVTATDINGNTAKGFVTSKGLSEMKKSGATIKTIAPNGNMSNIDGLTRGYQASSEVISSDGSCLHNHLESNKDGILDNLGGMPKYGFENQGNGWYRWQNNNGESFMAMPSYLDNGSIEKDKLVSTGSSFRDKDKNYINLNIYKLN